MFKHLTREEIKALRNFMGMSTRKLGREIGVSHATLYNIEHGVGQNSDRTNYRLLRFFVGERGLTEQDIQTLVELNQKTRK